MSSTFYPRGTDLRPTETYPVVQRAGMRFFRKVARSAVGVFRHIGLRGLFARDIVRAVAAPGTYARETVRQMRNMGVDSVPLACIVAAFSGAVIAIQIRYQLFPGVQLTLVGLASRLMIVLELGPLLTGLVLTGRVGARMTAEIGTMRVTEQIDALETLAYDPIAFLVVPRLIAGTLMLPTLVILADAVGLGSAYVISIFFTQVPPQDFREGLRLGYGGFQLFYSLLKGTLFGAAIAFNCAYEGYTTGTGAEGVGRSTARAVVITSVVILVLDAITAILLGPFLPT